MAAPGIARLCWVVWGCLPIGGCSIRQLAYPPAEPPPGRAPPRSSRRARPGRSTGTPSTIVTLRSAAALVSQRRSWYQRCIVRTLGGGRRRPRAAPETPRSRRADPRRCGSAPRPPHAPTARSTTRAAAEACRHGARRGGPSGPRSVASSYSRAPTIGAAGSARSRGRRGAAGTRRTRGRRQSQTLTPKPRATACARPRVRSAQIAQGSPLGRHPSRLVERRSPGHHTSMPRRTPRNQGSDAAEVQRIGASCRYQGPGHDDCR